jgi:hypothetical protein
MSERYDGYEDAYEDPYNAPPAVHPGANQGSGPWAPGYDPGANWNGGTPPPPPAPRYDYNGGSPVDQALTPGHGWEWQGPQTPTWDMSNNQWNHGVWQEVSGRGLGYVAPTVNPPPPPPPPGPDNRGRGSVPSIGGGGSRGPGATLPADILALFNKVPEKTPIQSAYQDALLKYMKRSQETPTLDDPILGPQTEVFRAANQRNTERNRRSAVERASAQGQNQSGYVDNLIQDGVQKQGFNNSQFNANLLGGELTKRREELQAGLRMAAATGDAEATRELQTRLAQVSAAMQQQGLNLQGQLGFGDLDLRWALGSEQLNQNALQLIMRGL